jgi:DNA-binding transcriptional MerR regulator/methylmalonyl-CoA mutase cobalamin-binding subunit
MPEDTTHGDEAHYPVRAVIARTGLTADVLRAWERRYGAVRPRRSAGGQRLYSEEDVARLTLLRRATQAGHSIAEVARLRTEALEALVDQSLAAAPATAPDLESAVIRAALAATERLDGPALEATLKRAALALGTGFVDRIAPRLLTTVGERWHDGALSPAHEHLATSVVRRVLDWVLDAHTPPARAPRLVVATPAGEHHELGAMLVAAAAVAEGWAVVYLGADLPASDIVAAAQQVRARAVALSAVYANGAGTLAEVKRTARGLSRGTTLFVGGPAIDAGIDGLQDAGGRVLADIPALRRALRRLRGEAGGEGNGGGP